MERIIMQNICCKAVSLLNYVIICFLLLCFIWYNMGLGSVATPWLQMSVRLSVFVSATFRSKRYFLGRWYRCFFVCVQIPFIYEHLFCKYFGLIFFEKIHLINEILFYAWFVRQSLGQATKSRNVNVKKREFFRYYLR